MTTRKPLHVLALSLLLSVSTGCGSGSEPQGPTGNVVLSQTNDIKTTTKLPGQTAMLDIDGTPLIGISMHVNDDGSVITENKLQVPVGTWTFRVTYKARYKPDEQVPLVVVAEAIKEGMVEANKDNTIQLDPPKTNFFDDNDAATNLEEVRAGTDPQNPNDWPAFRVALAAGDYHSLVFRTDNTPWAWGDNSKNQLGNIGNDNIGEMRTTPISVYLFQTINGVALAAGQYHSLELIRKALKCEDDTDGFVRAWGDNSSGQLGNPDPAYQPDTPTPVPVQLEGKLFTGVGAVSAGGQHSMALKCDGSVWTWGSNGFGQLGSPTPEFIQKTPVQVLGGEQGGKYLAKIVAVSAGKDFSLAITQDRSVIAWGSNSSGQLGTTKVATGEGKKSTTPVQVLGGEQGGEYLTNIVAVSAGDGHALALQADGTVWAWGENLRRQLGIGMSADDRPTPVRVKGADGTGYLTDVMAVSAGGSHSMALKIDGTVWTWGNNDSSQLGRPTAQFFQGTPVQVSGGNQGGKFLTDVIAISAGFEHSLALERTGVVWAWGSDGRGQLGNDSSDTPTKEQATPVSVEFP